MEWVKTILNAVRAALDGISASVDRLKSRVKSVEDWVKSLDWVPVVKAGGKITILPEAQLDTTSGTASFEPKEIPIVGETYTVVWDGTEYECTAFSINFLGTDVTVLGAPMSDIGSGDLDSTDKVESDIPFDFMFLEQNGKKSGALNTLEKGTYTASIYRQEENANKLPDIFIPDAVVKSIAESVTKRNPVFSGTFSLNRKKNSKVGSFSYAEGYECTASGDYSHAEGRWTIAEGDYSHAEGDGTETHDLQCHAEGAGAIANGRFSHAEGRDTKANGESSHAEGDGTKADGQYSHAEGGDTQATGICAHAEGSNTVASGYYSHAEGSSTKAKDSSTHAEGDSTIASGASQHVQGKYNVEDTFSDVMGYSKYAHIVGNGTANDKRSNAHTLDWHGVPWFQGRPQFGGTAQDNGSQSVVANGDKEFILASSTEGSTKKFKVTVDDSGTLKATEITN